jgi:hypothetical protein
VNIAGMRIALVDVDRLGRKVTGAVRSAAAA